MKQLYTAIANGTQDGRGKTTPHGADEAKIGSSEEDEKETS